MITKVRVLANIYVEGHVDNRPFQFSRSIPVYRYNAIRAFVKNCPLIKNSSEEDFQTVILITIVCSNDENALAILHGLEGCVKNSFLDELTRKKANTVDTEAIKIALNSVYGKDAFHADAYDILLQIENLCEEPEEEIDSVDTDINYVVDHLDSDDLFLQMAEEAAELSQECLKYVIADVQVCAEAIDITADGDIHDSKIHRWADRIRKKNGGSAK